METLLRSDRPPSIPVPTIEEVKEWELGRRKFTAEQIVGARDVQQLMLEQHRARIVPGEVIRATGFVALTDTQPLEITTA